MTLFLAVMLAASVLTSSDGSAEPVGDEPVTDEVVVETPVAPPVLTPYRYLYATYPSVAPRLDCIIQKESRWDPDAQNPRSGAAGLTQIMAGTWATTPQGRRGESRFNAYSNIDAAVWLATSGGGWRHWAATVGGC